MEKGTRIIYTEYGVTKHGVVTFSVRSSAGVVYNDILLDDGTRRLNRFDEVITAYENPTKSKEIG